MAHEKDGPVLRLGMGDNFAPDLFARTFQAVPGDFYPSRRVDGTCYPSTVRVPKDRFFYDHLVNPPVWKSFDRSYPAYEKQAGLGLTRIDFDNVAQFIADAKYNAIVPGKHDFYSGPEWLRDVARMLAKRNVHMLAANLIIVTTRAPQPSNVFPRTPERVQPPTAYLTDWGSISIDLPTMVLPYKRQFLVKNARSVTHVPQLGGSPVAPSEFRSLTRQDVVYSPLLTEPEICVEAGPTTSGDPRSVFGSGGRCQGMIPAETACTAPAPHLVSTCQSLYPSGVTNDPSHPTADTIYLFSDATSHLEPGLNHAFCAKLLGSNVGSKRDKTTCSPFSVQMPFLSYGDLNGASNGPAPYTIVGGKIAVFGIVDADLLTNVGLLNSGWLNDDHGRDTVTKVAPPDYSLKQALEQCAADDRCRPVPKVLMAQMSYAKAAQLVAQMSDTFDVVISQADQIHNTGERDLTDQPSAAQSTLHRRPASMFVLTPPEPFSLDTDPTVAHPEPTFTPQVSRATIVKTETKWELHNSVKAAAPERQSLPVCPGVPSLTLRTASETALLSLKAQNVPPPPPPPLAVAPDPSDALRDLALLARQRTLHTDIAFLQRRDLFDGDHQSQQSLPRGELQNQINRVFWKGDFVIPLHVTGATLKKLMKQSKKFDELDHDLLSTEIEMGRSLLSIGIWNDPKDTDSYYINGAKLDDAKLYTVAATEFLALGDTGFPDLATPDVPPATRIEDFSQLQALSRLICKQIKRTPSYGDVTCDEDNLNIHYFDASSQVPFDRTPGFYAATHYITAQRRFLPIPVPATGVSGKVQQRPFYSLNLESLDFTYGGTYIEHVSKASAKFAGISAPGVTTSGSNSLGSDHKLRGIYDFGPGTFYVLNDSAFTKTNTGTAQFATITNNMWGMEGGGTIRFRHNRPSWLSFQYSGRFEGQLTDPSPTAIKLNVGSNLLLNPPQISTLYGRLGLRAEFGDIYVESGLEQINSQHVLTAYAFTTTAGIVSCTPQAGIQFLCLGGTMPGPIAADGDLTSNLPVKTSVTDYLTGGAYLNFNIKFPLWSRRDANGADQSWYFTVTNKGDLYFNSRNDTSVQTRYLDKFTPSFNIPIYGKLTLTPKVDFIFYEDKVAHRHFASATPALSLSYSFNFREGMNFWRSLGYGAITQMQPTSSK